MSRCLLAAWVLCGNMAYAAGPAEIPLRDFARFPEYEAVSISPSGKYLSVRVPKEDQTVLAILRLADMKVTGVVRLQRHEHVLDHVWVGPERVLFSIGRKFGPIDNPTVTGELLGVNADGSRQAYLYGYRGKSSSQVSAAEFGSARVVAPLLDDPSRALVATRLWNAGQDSFGRVYLMDKFTGFRREVVTAPQPGPAQFLADRNGEVRFVTVVDPKSVVQTYWRRPGSDEWILENRGALAGAEVTPLQFSADGREVYLRSTEKGDTECLVRYAPGADTPREVLACHDQVDLATIHSWGSDSDPFAAQFHAGKPSYQFLDRQPEERKLMELLSRSFGGDFVEAVSETRDGSRAVLKVYSDRRPPEYYLFDRTRGQAKYLASSRRWIDPRQMAERRPVSYPARDGRTISGYLTLPAGREAKGLPLVVHPHGGPFGIRDVWEWSDDPQVLASRGYAVLQVNFRGSGGYGRKHLAEAKKDWGGVMIDDITDGARWVVAQGYADPKRLCIYGASYGGYASLMSAVREPDLYRCVVGYVGAYDLNLLYEDSDIATNSRGENYFKDFIGKTREERAAQSPLTYIDRLKAPILIVHGKEDWRTPFSQAEALREALDRREHPYEWLAKDKEGHGFYKEDNRVEFFEKLIGFLDRHIGPESK